MKIRDCGAAETHVQVVAALVAGVHGVLEETAGDSLPEEHLILLTAPALQLALALP